MWHYVTAGQGALGDDCDNQDLEQSRNLSPHRSCQQQFDHSISDSSDGEDYELPRNASPSLSRQKPRGRAQLDTASDREMRRCRSLSNDRDRQGTSVALAVSDADMMDGVQPLIDADCSVRSQLSLSVDCVNVSSNKRKAVATLPGNEQKSHRSSL